MPNGVCSSPTTTRTPKPTRRLSPVDSAPRRPGGRDRPGDAMDRPEPVELSAAVVQALRQAEQVCCRHVRGASSLGLSLDGELGGELRVFTASQQRLFPDPDRVDPHARSRHITCAATVSGYDEDERWWFL